MRLLITLVGIVTLLGACEGGGAGGGEGLPNFQASCGPQQNRAAPELRRISLQLPWFANGEHSYTHLGKRLGIFAAHGFDVEIVTGRGSEVAARALGAGNVDAAILGGDALVLVRAEGGAVESIGAVYRDSPVTIYSLREKGITRPEHLYGRRLGLLPGSNTVTQYEAFASIRRLNRNQIDEVQVNPLEAPNWILNSGRLGGNSAGPYLDALVHYWQFEPLGTQSRDQRFNNRFNRIDLKDLGFRIYGMVLAVHKDRFSVTQLIHLKQAIYDSFVCARRHPQQAIDALAAENPEQEYGIGEADRQFAERQLAAVILMACAGRGSECREFLSQEDDQWQATFLTMRRARMISDIPNLDGFRRRVPLLGGVADR